jgi:metallophosphoesterase (TIGR00282 family)
LVVVNLIGRTFLAEVDCPFRAMDALLENLDGPPTVIVDFHAEATSEKAAMGRYLDGRVSAVLGTHTHVATADALVLPGGTAYVTDLGMTGPINSIIGDDIDNVLRRFLYGLPHRISVASGRGMLNSVLVDIDEFDGKARHIMRIDREMV